MKMIALVAAALLATVQPAAGAESLDAVARDYVRLSLEMDVHDSGYVDAYYGPAELREAARAAPRSVADIAGAVTALRSRLESIPAGQGTIEARRKTFLMSQLVAADHRIRLVRGGTLSFAEEARGIYGVDVEGLLHPLSHYDPILERIERLVPGEGPLAARVEAIQNRFVIPRDRLDAVMRAAIAECRRRTLPHIPLPDGEAFTLEFVTNRSWSGYNWYQGNYRSLIQVNTDQQVRMSRAVDLGCHEGYPGHHVSNILLERELGRGREWIEFTLLPLYSPQGFIGEGTANYGIQLAFPGNERLAFETRVLYPLAGLPAAEAQRYNELNAALDALGSVRFTIAREFLEGRIDRAQAIALLQRYQLVTPARAAQSVDFMQQYRAYIINYGLGRDIVAAYIERGRDTPEARWVALRELLSAPAIPADLLE